MGMKKFLVGLMLCGVLVTGLIFLGGCDRGILQILGNNQLEVGQTRQFSLSNADEGTPITWSVSNTDLASIDAQGRLTAIAPGSVTITASQGPRRNAHLVVHIVTP